MWFLSSHPVADCDICLVRSNCLDFNTRFGKNCVQQRHLHFYIHRFIFNDPVSYCIIRLVSLENTNMNMNIFFKKGERMIIMLQVYYKPKMMGKKYVLKRDESVISPYLRPQTRYIHITRIIYASTILKKLPI